MRDRMTAAERVGAVLRGEEPDRVPFFLTVTMHGARELGLGMREYFSSAASVAEGQLRLQARYGHDCLDSFLYAAAELEAFGGEALWRDDGPANAGAPIAHTPGEIRALEPPRVADCAVLSRGLETIALLKAARPDVPIIGVVIAPFSLPAMQLGLGWYLEVMHERPDVIDRLLQVNEEFCVEWGNAQLRAGASFLCYFDPLASPAMVAPEITRRTAFPVARRVMSRLEGPAVTSLASAACIPIVDDLCATGAIGVHVGPSEELSDVHAACRGRLVVLGNLNGVAMRGWNAAEAETEVKRAIASGASGRFILVDGHGEIPLQVPEETVEALADAVRRWGRFPLSWIAEDAKT